MVQLSADGAFRGQSIVRDLTRSHPSFPSTSTGLLTHYVSSHFLISHSAEIISLRQRIYRRHDDYVLRGNLRRTGQGMPGVRARGQRVRSDHEASTSLSYVLRTPYSNYEGILSPARLLRQFPIRLAPLHRLIGRPEIKVGNIPDQACSVALGVDFASFLRYWIGVLVQAG